MPQSQDNAEQGKNPMADAKTTEQQLEDMKAQLSDFRTNYRLMLQEHYGFNEKIAALIADGSPKEMEANAETLYETVSPNDHSKSRNRAPSQHHDQNKEGDNKSHGKVAQTYMNNTYSLPASLGGK